MEDCFSKITLAALMNNIQYKEHQKLITKKKPSSLDEFLKRFEEYISVEDSQLLLRTLAKLRLQIKIIKSNHKKKGAVCQSTYPDKKGEIAVIGLKKN